MIRVLKQSPLCSRAEGREVFFTLRTDAGKLRVVLPHALLDDTCGGDAGEASRKSWVRSNMPGILNHVTGAPTALFDRVLVEEIS